MAQKTNSFEKFWKEIKRRKTGKVIVAYAATAFILLQLADILTPALLLPEWTTRLVTLILIIGFPIAVIFSWVFDITPEGLKKTESIEESEERKIVPKPVKRVFKASNIIIAVLIIAVGILAFPKIFKPNTLEKLRSSGERISVAVMPFKNMTNDTTMNIWQDGIQINLITSLSNNPEELQVRQTESFTNLIQSKGSVDYASLTPAIASKISQKLDADFFINGYLNQAGSTIRLNAQLVVSKTADVLKSFRIDGSVEDIIPLIDSLSVMLRNFLLITREEKELPGYSGKYISTSSPLALRYYIYGRNYFYKFDYPTARNWLSQAISVDTNFTQAITMLSIAYGNEFLWEKETKSYGNEFLYDQAKKWCIRAYARRDQMPPKQKININWIHAVYFETPNEQIRYLKQLLDFDDQNPTVYTNLGNSYSELHQYDKAIPEYKKALELYQKWEVKPDWSFDYTSLGEAYHKLGNYKEEERVYKKAEQYFPYDPTLLYDLAVFHLTSGDTVTANRIMEQGISYMRSISMSEASIIATGASVYADAGLLDEAMNYYRRALTLEAESPVRLNDLAYFLIDKDRNVKEGIELVEKALEIKPENYLYLHTKGWGLYKLGKYKEALEVLQKSWDLRRQHAIYDHAAYIHLETAKKAVPSLRNY
jgi:tetratricopeptide (TPR) repeat protein